MEPVELAVNALRLYLSVTVTTYARPHPSRGDFDAQTFAYL